MSRIERAGLLLLTVLAGCVSTEPFRDAEGNTLPDSVAVMQTLPINGDPQMVWFRGSGVGKPALILLHGGPGASESALFHDLVQFGRGNAFSLAALHDESTNVALDECCTSFEVPVYFLLGRFDMNTPAPLAKRYFESIDAPLKQLVWFEESAHNPPFEEPDEFNRVVIDIASRTTEAGLR